MTHLADVMPADLKIRKERYKKNSELTGFKSYESFRKAHLELVNEALSNNHSSRVPEWTESIAVESKSYVESSKDKLNVLAKGRKIIEKGGEFFLREELRILGL